MKLKNGEELTLEKAKKEDAQKILDYCNVVGGESDNLTFGENEFPKTLEEEQIFIENISTSKTNALLVGKINDEIVCVGSVVSQIRERLSHQCDIGISVKKKYWNNGVATHLMNEIISFARQNGVCEIIHLGVRSDNVYAMRLYKKFGFEKIGVYKKFFKINGEYFDEILMNLYL